MLLLDLLNLLLLLNVSDVPPVVDNDQVGVGDVVSDGGKELLLPPHDGGLGVGDEDEYVGILTELLYPSVGAGGDIHPRTIHQGDIILQCDWSIL